MARRLERGFTLLEVMVALVIFAIVSVALVKNATMSVKQTSIIQDRTVAWWLAENAITQLRIQPRNDDNYPNPGISRDTISVSDKEWEVETTIESTENEFVRRVEISVYTYGQEDAPAAVLTGFLGRY